jgi:deoxyribodipyrimidine photo-lyase
MTQKRYKLGLHWFRHDLRTIDNQALLELSQQAQQVVAVYVFDPSGLSENKFGCKHLGEHRHTFIDQSLVDLQTALSALNIPLLLLSGQPISVVNTLISTLEIECMSIESHYGLNETRQVQAIESKFDDLPIIKANSHYLLEHEQLPFELEQMPNVFSPFRRKVEKRLQIRRPASTIEVCISPANIDPQILSLFDAYKLNRTSSDNHYSGGQSGALERINNYFFESDNIARYKETRNGLDGWDFSSRFSAFLANGNISPALIVDRLHEYEASRTKNDSTYWMFFELLWREFFHLQSNKQGKLFFDYGGIQQAEPSNKHDIERFEKWKNGTTGYQIVDACMRQLNNTGFMSNRGRQLVASCFVHELTLDWRYGAAYFEEMLIDFDVASNYGNWQYLAGVGSDPRGHRQFNLQKQTEIYDPNKRFINAWL